MADDKKAPRVFRWTQSKEGVHEYYANVVISSWTLTDVRFRLGQLVPTSHEPNAEFVAEERAAVTVAWPQVKWLRDTLNDIIARYEKVNGEIKTPTLPKPD